MFPSENPLAHFFAHWLRRLISRCKSARLLPYGFPFRRFSATLLCRLRF
jgi:hypothetical protein